MTNKPQNVRPATVEDSDSLYDMLCIAYKENAPYRFSEKKVRHMIAEGACDKVVIIGVIDGTRNDIAGSIGAMFSQWWYTEDWHIEECWNFVREEYRSFNGMKHAPSYGSNLIDYVKWISEQMVMPAHIGILTADRLEAKERLYSRKLERVGSAFVHNMQAAQGPIAKELVHG